MKETIIVQIIIAATFCCLIYLAAERLRQKRDRKRLKHVIYVNGSRGKSSVTRLIDAGLREGGFRVVSKTTGTLPMIRHTDGRVEEIKRRAPANIREQLRILHLAAREETDVLVVECMALLPENQFVSQHRMLEADIGVLTNVRLDHTDVLGETKEEILESLLSTMPENGVFLTAEKELFGRIDRKGKRLGTKCVLAEPSGADEGIDFSENVALARLACEAVGMDAATAGAGMRKYIRDPYSREILRIGKTVFVNALSANDTESTLKVSQEGEALLPPGAKRVLLLNNRSDRPSRTMAMCELARQWKPNEVYLIGQELSAVKRWLKRHVPESTVRCFAAADDVPLAQEEATLLLAAGNIRGPGIDLTERARLLAEKEE